LIAYFLPSFVVGAGIPARIPRARWIVWIGAGMLALAMPVGTALALVAMIILGVIVGGVYLFRDVIDPPYEQVLTPLRGALPDPMPERPEFRMPDLPRAPGQ
jgi:hypothetical protein